jgi:D-alanyl-D-alanine carboxypeptidase
MTIYVTFRAIRAGEINFDSRILYSANAAKEPPSKMGFKPGTTLTLDDALKMMMVKSANDIAVAVAEAVGGSVQGFADRMNEAARELGMTQSHFHNPNGLPDTQHYTSARDMAIVARALLTEFPAYRDYFKLPGIEIGGRVIKNYNTLLAHYPGATGMKTGFICSSGFNLVASARRGDRELIAVVFGQYGGKFRRQQAATLLDDGFASPQPPDGQKFVTLATVTDADTFATPMDMRPYICGPKRVRVASEADDEGDDDSVHLTDQPFDLGPPIHVSALVPIDMGDAGFIAPLPRPRPGEGATLMNAYAPGDAGAGAADAIGAIIDAPAPLDAVPKQ